MEQRAAARPEPEIVDGVLQIYGTEEVGCPVAQSSASARAFHASLPGYAVTPLHQSTELARFLGVQTVLVKDERLRFGLPSFKVLGAVWAAACCLSERSEGHDGSLTSIRALVAATDPLIFVTATDGNHGRAVAYVAKLFGAESLILLPSAVSSARADAISREGAHVVRINGTYDDAVHAAEVLASRATNVVLVADTTQSEVGGSSDWVIEGYATIFDELEEQLGLDGAGRNEHTLVAIQAGVGALAAAAVRYFRASWPREQTRLITVEPESSACVKEALRAGQPVTLSGSHESVMEVLNAGHVSSSAWPEIATGIDAAVPIHDEVLVTALHALVKAGLDAGESGAAGLAGAKVYIANLDPQDVPERVIVVLTEDVIDSELHERLLAHGLSGPTRDS